MDRVIDSDVMIANLQQHFDDLESLETQLTKEDSKQTKEHLKLHEELIYEYYSFLKQLDDNIATTSLRQKLNKLQKKFGEDAEEYVCKVEVLDELKQIRVMYFKKPDVIKKYW